MTKDPLLQLESVRVTYGDFVAVNDVSFTLHGGDLLGLIGPNGAGKTTTLRAAAGLQSVATGQVTVMGADATGQPTRVGEVLGFTPDTPPVYDTLRVDDFLRFIGRCHGLPRALREERIDHWLEMLWLQDKRTAKIRTLSRGMRQRLAVARTLLPDPHVVLLDEPASGLDPAGRIQFRRMLASLRDQGKAIIVSSHILADLAEYCTHIGIMEHGRLLRYGTVGQVAGAESQERCLYRAELAHAVGDANVRLHALAGLTRIAVEGRVVTFEFEREPTAAAGLLADIIAAGLPVAEFRPLAPNLEEAYLRSGIRQVD